MSPEFRVIGPCGKMEEILTKFGASPDVKMRFARRAGAVVGNGIAVRQLEEAILDTSERGAPCWGPALDRLGQMVNRVYRGKNGKATIIS